MRLLNTKTLVFGDFLDAQVPHYAILSHRWGKQEVSYKGLDWAWIDTCCIDKRSSAELSEVRLFLFE